MQRERARALRERIAYALERYSNPDRPANRGGETFLVEEVKPMGDDIAMVILRKEPTKKRALLVFWWQMDSWWYMTPSTTQAAAMLKVYDELLRVEHMNYERNFDDRGDRST